MHDIVGGMLDVLLEKSVVRSTIHTLNKDSTSAAEENELPINTTVY